MVNNSASYVENQAFIDGSEVAQTVANVSCRLGFSTSLAYGTLYSLNSTIYDILFNSNPIILIRHYYRTSVVDIHHVSIRHCPGIRRAIAVVRCLLRPQPTRLRVRRRSSLAYYYKAWYGYDINVKNVRLITIWQYT